MHRILNTPALRDTQEQALHQTLEAFRQGYQTVVIQAPTGTGKTLLSRYIAESFKSTLVGVPTIALQDQYETELGKTGGVAILKGKARYECILALEEGDHVPVSEARCQFDDSGKQLRTCDTLRCCEYLEARKEAAEARIAVLSFAGQLAYAQFAPDFFGKRDLHLVDEAHKMEDIVRDQFSIVKSESEIRRQFGKHAKDLPPMPLAGTTQDLLDYLSACVAVALGRIQELMGVYKCESLSELFLKSETSTMLYRSLAPVLAFKENITALFEASAQDNGAYVTYIELKETKKGKEPHIVSKPVHLQKIVQEHVLSEKNVFMSATLVGVEAWAKSLGIENYKFLDIPSSFPAKNRRVFFTPIGNLNAGNVVQLIPKGCDFVRKLKKTPHFKNEKGLIHTPSYDLTARIYNELVDVPDVLCAVKGDSGRALQMHVRKPEPTILIGPAFKEGIDLKDSLCRFQIIWKCGYGNPNDPLLMAKRQKDPSWEVRRIISDFIQQIGRGVRSKDDWAVTYVLDGNLAKILIKNRKLVPGYIWEAFQNIANCVL